jgi:restriction endonuclease S subunit
MSDLPNGWTETRLGNTISLNYGKSLPATVRDGGQFAVFGSNGIVGYHSEAITAAPAIVVGRKGSFGEVHFSEDACFPIDTTYYVDAFSTLDARFAFHLLRHLPLTEMNRASAIPGLNREDAYGLDIALPPLPEQRRIVAKVDGLTARTARARKELDRIPTLIARYKHRLLALAFSGELTASWRSHNKNAHQIVGRSAAEIRSKYSADQTDEFEPPFATPSTWRWLRLPEIGDLDRGKSRHRPRNDPKLFGGPYPFVQTGDVRAADRLLTEFSTTYSEFGLEQSRLWPIGTVCITIAANIAETAILGIEACFPDSVVGFLPDVDRVSGEFVEFFIRTMRSELEAFAPATAQKNINLNVLSSVRVPVPPLEEQAEIVRRIESAFGWLDRMAADHDAAVRLIPKLDAAILAKAFQGKLVPQDPNDEPAAKLLERIKAERAATATKLQKSGRGRPRKVGKAVRASTDVGLTAIAYTDSSRPKGKSGMTKSRQDDDVLGKPYLAGLLKSGRFSDAQSLFRVAELPVADFYKQLAWEIDKGHILDSADELKAA